MKQSLQTVAYGNAVISSLPFDQAVERVKTLLGDEGFGILCDIDVGKTLQHKLGLDFPPYRILGACNPTLAHKALSAEPQLGLLLPCNVVVQEQDGQVVVSAIDANAMLALAKHANLEPIAQDVNARLNRVLSLVAS
jgi:uncharacterized protein (DUF302 family)